ncbi:probable thiopurine S-methyltransferase [Lingula anatina]|uniref:thiopurine S-methyltransferase n=1 Tax=Lingula anatina TaxID=7574 RepID=A0A1S3HS64_LINAN|nr:probable thiopurine S-methyltransferase [Lingula anatina]|eukprot:XP_013388873.1 probable thiopurine S-methyltransferase [Lingula anatina]
MADASSERLDGWIGAWERNSTRWHMPNVNCFLEEFLDVLLAGKKAAKILVPLCGKTIDMKWLADLGHTVIGVDGAEKAATEFFTEQNIAYKVEPCDAIQGTLCCSMDNKIRIYVGDFFKFNQDFEGQFDAIWDRASLVAIDESDRLQYVNILNSVLKPGCHCLIEAMDFIPSEKSGSPHAIPLECVRELFGNDYNVKLLKCINGQEDGFYSLAPFAPLLSRFHINAILVSKL